jgi:uncharacterized protein with HEPN domain
MLDGERPAFRVRHIKEAIGLIRGLLAGKSVDDVRDQPHTQAAFERYLEIVSEASRHVPDPWKQEHGPAINWRRIADLGNHLRHAYDRGDLDLLWSIYAYDLDELEDVIDKMIADHPVEGEDDE